MARHLEPRLKAVMRRIYLRQLGIIFPALTVYYALLTVGHYFALQGMVRTVIMSLSVVACGVALISYWMIKTERVGPARAHISMVPIGLMVVANVTAHVFVTDDILQLTNNIIALLGFGFLILELRVYLFFNLLMTAVYIAYLSQSSSPFVPHFGFMLFTGQVLACLSFANRYLGLKREIMLSLEKKDQNRELERALAQAAAAGEAKSRFLANTSHELRTPLTGIIGMIDLLSKSELDAEQHGLLETASGSADGLLRVLNDILDSAALEKGRLSIVNKPFSIVSVVESTVRLWRPRAEDKGLELVSESQSVEDVWVDGDRVRIGQILFNLMSNAVKFTEKGQITISAAYRAVAAGSSDPANPDKASDTDDGVIHMEITIRDMGSGIAPEKLPILFDRFSQADVTKTREHGGTGLGLSISNDIADLMGGEIRVESDVGIGSAFTLVLDLPKAQAPKEQSREEAVSVMDVEKRPMRLLLAEDNPINQALIKKLIKRTGWVTTVVNNGEEAVDAAFTNILPFDLILMDIQMPKMDGVTAFKKIREGLNNCPPVIALTANTSPEDVQAYDEAGFSGFVGKPIDPALLIGEMDRLMKG